LRSEIWSESAMRSASTARNPSPKRSRACRKSLSESVDGPCAAARSRSAPWRPRRPPSARDRWPGPAQCRQPYGQYRASDSLHGARANRPRTIPRYGPTMSGAFFKAEPGPGQQERQRDVVPDRVPAEVDRVQAVPRGRQRRAREARPRVGRSAMTSSLVPRMATRPGPYKLRCAESLNGCPTTRWSLRAWESRGPPCFRPASARAGTGSQ
jgi:hypothetical protein